MVVANLDLALEDLLLKHTCRLVPHRVAQYGHNKESAQAEGRLMGPTQEALKQNLKVPVELPPALKLLEPSR